MSTRYILATTLQEIETSFAIPPQTITLIPNYNITPGQYVPVITGNNPYQVKLFRFGLTPFWAKSDMLLTTARAEGDYNQSDDPKIKSAAGIIQKKAFRKPIRSQRCIVIASAFIEGIGTYGTSKPHVVYLRNHQNPFPIAGIWDTWHSPSGDTINSFCIITTTANNLLQKIGSRRMPVILTYSQAKKWINPATELTTITQMLKKYDSGLMNAYPIDPAIKNSTLNDKQLLKPTGSKILTEENSFLSTRPKSIGYHNSLNRHDPNKSRPSLGEISANNNKT